MTQKKQADSNEELKNIPQEETATTDAPETVEGVAPETAAEPAVTAETVKAEMMDRVLRPWVASMRRPATLASSRSRRMGEEDELTMATTRDARMRLPNPMLRSRSWETCAVMLTPDSVPARGTFPARFSGPPPGGKPVRPGSCCRRWSLHESIPAG